MHKSLGAEDFPEFLQDAPGAMYTLGTMIEGRPVYELHHPKFDLDERALPVGAAVLAETAKRFLTK
jgi:amidohydrolase